MLTSYFDNRPYLIELLTPKQNARDFDAALERFDLRYHKILEHDGVASIPDNPMGNLHFTAVEVLQYLELPIRAEQLLIHLNSFHRKVDLDEMLEAAAEMGVRYLLCVSGDGSPRLPKLDPADLDSGSESVTSVELLSYIRSRFGGRFTLGVAYNHYEPAEHEAAKLARKIEAGAEFVVTQPVLGRSEAVESLSELPMPVYLGAWMSKKIDLLYSCVGREPAEGALEYRPRENLRNLHRLYPDHGYYLSLLPFKQSWDEVLLKQAVVG